MNFVITPVSYLLSRLEATVPLPNVASRRAAPRAGWVSAARRPVMMGTGIDCEFDEPDAPASFVPSLQQSGRRSRSRVVFYVR